jgi:flavin reductase (DIM6/NTAB) family NADH-FMN oxidoreductase RutF
VSINPPRFLVGLLSDEHRDLARLFGSETGDRVDKFSRCQWWEGPQGLPILGGAAAWFAGREARRRYSGAW